MKAPPPEKRREDCECELEIIPFDCEMKTCECENVVRSEPCGIRFQNKPDAFKIGYRSVANNAMGRFVVERIHPDSGQVNQGDLTCSKVPCAEEEHCLAALDLTKTARPVGLNDLSLGPPPSKLRPHSDGERYRVELICDPGTDDPCTATLEFPVFDGDLTILCYNFGLNQAGLDFFGSGPIPANRLTVRQFFARLGENGARALVGLYYQSVTECERTFRHPAWAACFSAVLAEEFYRGFVEKDLTLGYWREFHALNDLELTGAGISPRQFESRSEIFGYAHVLGGGRSALQKCGTNPCCAHDLNLISETLANAQTTLLQSIQTDPALSLSLGRLIGQDPQRRFLLELRRNLAKALYYTRHTRCLSELTRRYGWRYPW